MSDDSRTDLIMRQMGFGPDDEGPLVSKLRGEMARQVHEHGLIRRSAGTWAPEHGLAGMNLSQEERARAFLEVEWIIARGYTSEVRCLDRPFGWRYNFKRDKWKYEIAWSDILVWLGDRWRLFRLDCRVGWDRLRGIRNPYARKATP